MLKSPTANRNSGVSPAWMPGAAAALRPTPHAPRLAALWLGVVVLTAGLAGCVQPPAGPSPAGKIDAKDELAKRLAKDPVAVLEDGLARYDRTVTSYTCTLYKQERLNPQGAMGPRQKMACKFMEKPFSVCTETVENPLGAKKALYVEGRWGNRMLVQPLGLGFLLGFPLVEPRSPQARATTLRFIDQFGFKRSAENMVRGMKAARKENFLKCALLGTATVEGRDTIVFEAQATEPSPSGRFEFPRFRVFLDREWLLPLAVDTWDAAGIERGHYRYADVNFKAGLSAKDFVPEANGMKSPKETPTSQPK